LFTKSAGWREKRENTQRKEREILRKKKPARNPQYSGGRKKEQKKEEGIIVVRACQNRKALGEHNFSRALQGKRKGEVLTNLRFGKRVGRKGTVRQDGLARKQGGVYNDRSSHHREGGGAKSRPRKEERRGSSPTKREKVDDLSHPKGRL